MTSISTTADQIPASTIIPMLIVINYSNYPRFKELEKTFVTQHGVEVWKDVFNFRVLSALDQQSSRWPLHAWCSKGIVSVKDVLK
ncbi:hypothetical protein [Dendronalium sp. ChiSLP03b]|uniref:hypothetical protein n=1 Tax=Dendronalium sp. ChiSLP03b TaxID=3075381 RepID=UPI002AD26DDB|nr:hypothetical protein [Dendronalium sp. ChiSLP03b]MDZ8205436.1 hypothetical protein [Dendronalium sp. ChiSLP03b]